MYKKSEQKSWSVPIAWRVSACVGKFLMFIKWIVIKMYCSLKIKQGPGRWLFVWSQMESVFFSSRYKLWKIAKERLVLILCLRLFESSSVWLSSTWNKCQNIQKRQMKRKHPTIIIAIIRFQMIASHYWNVYSKIIKKSLLRWKHHQDQLITCTYSFP